MNARLDFMEESLSAFESIYAQAKGDAASISWADLAPNPNMIHWFETNPVDGRGKHALVVGCGLGDDAEELARRGYETTAFDISPSAMRWCRRRFPASVVNYVAADLFHVPGEWRTSFDFVLESYTLQILPAELRHQAIRLIAAFVVPEGILLLIARGRDASDPLGDSPWPLTRGELGLFGTCGMIEMDFKDFLDDENPPVRRFMVTYQRG